MVRSNVALRRLVGRFLDGQYIASLTDWCAAFVALVRKLSVSWKQGRQRSVRRRQTTTSQHPRGVLRGPGDSQGSPEAVPGLA